MKFPAHVWKQIKGTTADELIKALSKDGWVEDAKIGAKRAFRKATGQRVVIHYHPQKTYQPGLLKALLTDIGWSEKQMKKLKLIKK